MSQKWIPPEQNTRGIVQLLIDSKTAQTSVQQNVHKVCLFFAKRSTSILFLQGFAQQDN